MAYRATIIQIFISSPGDVLAERKFVINEMQAWNQRNSLSSGCFLSPVTWEDVVAPDQDDYSQNVINKQIGDAYDVFLGLMWGRFGTPTRSADSGTEEEYLRAIARKDLGDHLNLSFFFKTSPMPIKEIDTDQLKKVNEFKDKISQAGFFYREFSEEIHLSRGLNILFDNIKKDVEKYSGSDQKSGFDTRLAKGKTEKKVQFESEVEESEELGIFDLSDLLESSANSIGSLVSDWGDRITDLGAAMKATTEDLNDLSRFGQPDNQLVRQHVDKTADKFDEFAEFCEVNIDTIEIAMTDLVKYLHGIADVSSDFDQSQDDIESAQLSITQLIDGMNGAMDGTNSLVVAIAGLPRLSKRFNKSRERVVRVQKKFLELMEQNVSEVSKVNNQIEALALSTE